MPRQRVLRLALEGVLVLVVLLGAWWLLRTSESKPQLAADVAAAGRAGTAAGQAADGWPARQAPPKPASAAMAASASASALGAGLPGDAAVAAGDSKDERVWDLCGVGRMPAPPQMAASAPAELAIESLPSHLGSEAMAQAKAALWGALEAGPPRWRAAAMVLRGTDAAGRITDPALRALSLAGVDPVMDQWALHTCGEARACAEAQAQRWAQHDGDNLAAWAAVLQHAPPQRQEEILSRMAQSTRFEIYPTALTATVLQALPDSVPAYLQVQMWLQFMGIEHVMLHDFRPIALYCREPLAPGSVAHDRCTTMARTMIAHSDTTIGTAIGLRLAERTYMSPAESKRQRDALYAVPAQALDEMFDFQQPLSCEGVRRMRNYVQLRVQKGEVGAWQALAAARAASATAR